MKRKSIIIIILFFALFMGGCSCNKSMCKKGDLEAIKQSITEKWENDEQYKIKLQEEALSKDISDPDEIEKYVNQKIQKKIESEYSDHPKACMTTEKMTDPDSGAAISSKSWKDAFKTGLLEGLIVYPISWLLISFSSLFGGNGVAKVLSITLTTILIKCFMLLVTFKQQVQMQRLQSIQGELNEISVKIKNPSLSQNERTRLQMKMLDLYKKNGINPFGAFIPQLISFPILLSVWAAVNQTLIIRSGTFFGIELGHSISNQFFDFNIGAILLFALFATIQVLSMKLPNILRKKYETYKTKNNPSATDNQMKTMMNVMIVMIIVTGFMFPAALVIYWLIGGLFAMAQTLVFQNPKVKEKISNLGNRKKKAKVVK